MRNYGVIPGRATVRREGKGIHLLKIECSFIEWVPL